MSTASLQPQRDPSRIQGAYRELQDALCGALRQHDQIGYCHYSPELCEVAAHFRRELQRVTGKDEVRRRAHIRQELTGDGTPYAEAIQRAEAAGLRPFHSCPRGSRNELEGVRRLLGPGTGKSLTPQQRTALRLWERELERIEEEATKLHSDGCNWLCSLSDARQLLEDGAPFPADQGTAEYNSDLVPTVIRNVITLAVDAIRQMQEAADALESWASEMVTDDPAITGEKRSTANGGSRTKSGETFLDVRRSLDSANLSKRAEGFRKVLAELRNKASDKPVSADLLQAVCDRGRWFVEEFTAHPAAKAELERRCRFTDQQVKTQRCFHALREALPALKTLRQSWDEETSARCKALQKVVSVVADQLISEDPADTIGASHLTLLHRRLDLLRHDESIEPGLKELFKECYQTVDGIRKQEVILAAEGCRFLSTGSFKEIVHTAFLSSDSKNESLGVLAKVDEAVASLMEWYGKHLAGQPSAGETATVSAELGGTGKEVPEGAARSKPPVGSREIERLHGVEKGIDTAERHSEENLAILSPNRLKKLAERLKTSHPLLGVRESMTIPFPGTFPRDSEWLPGHWECSVYPRGQRGKDNLDAILQWFDCQVQAFEELIPPPEWWEEAGLLESDRTGVIRDAHRLVDYLQERKGWPSPPPEPRRTFKGCDSDLRDIVVHLTKVKEWIDKMAILQAQAERAKKPSAPKGPVKRKRRVAPETARKRAEKEHRRKQDQQIFEAWQDGEWENYTDYGRWQNEHLPEGWKELTRRDVELALQRHKARLKRQGKWPPDECGA